MSILTALSFLVVPLLAYPSGNSSGDIIEAFLRERSPSFEWTAWGDSYASGVGSGKYLQGRRCLRYEEAYPKLIDDDPDKKIHGKGGKFNNVVCSGAKSEEIEQHQFYDKDQNSGQPNWQYYPRPGSGKPTMGTLTVGGDDIDFPGILSNCIVDGFPWPLSAGFTHRSCEDQRKITWGLIAEGDNKDKPNSKLVKDIDGVIKKAVKYGQDANGKFFRLYVTGYGQFFNDEDPGCDTVTFARTANPNPDGKDHTMLTRDLRKEFNRMSRTLNAAIKKAVEKNKNENVKYIDIDAMLDGHRFCEKGIQEPDQNNEKNYFWHYPYNQNDDATNEGIKYLNTVAKDNFNTNKWDPKSGLWVDHLNEFWDKVDEDGLYKAIGAKAQDDGDDGDGDVGPAYDFWGDTIGWRARLFHPRPNFHREIYHEIAKQYVKDTDADPDSVTSTKPPEPTETHDPAPAYATGRCCFHVNEYEDCKDMSKNLYADIRMVDHKKDEIYKTPDKYFDDDGLGMPINDGDKATFQGKLPHPIEITGEHQDDYIRFTYGSQTWTSRNKGNCKIGGWDPNNGPVCNAFMPGTFPGVPVQLPDQPAKNQIDCCFDC